MRVFLSFPVQVPPPPRDYGGLLRDNRLIPFNQIFIIMKVPGNYSYFCLITELLLLKFFY